MRDRTVLCQIACALALASWGTSMRPAGRLLAAPPLSARTIETSGLEYITPACDQSIQRGLEFLSIHQADDGSWGSNVNFKGHVAVTALGGMAMLAAGHTPNRGKYGRQVEQAVQYLLDNTDPTGLISAPDHRQHNPMYGHGFAALFLAEVYGLTPRPEIKDKLKLAVNLIVKTQNKEGGWRYFPVRREADVSVTVCQIMALRSARNAGIYVPKNTVDNCINYVKKCQNRDGGFSYQLSNGEPATPSLWPRSAAGLVALYSAGIYEGPEIEAGLAYLRQHTPRGEVFRNEIFYFYGHYYAVQAMWHAGGQYWRQWYPAVRDELMSRQQGDGSWPDMAVCPEYGTAMACIALQLPNCYLPIFQR